jgi:hypothetical protein
MKIPISRRLAWLAVAVCLAGVSAAGALGAQTQPILAGPWSMGQKGYGHVRPVTIFNGGDPTGLVRYIHWTSWGGRQAIGEGIGTYVGPHQITAEGTQQIARIVLFQLGRCRGRRAYDAIEWYYPQHGERFNPRQYINACTGAYYPMG